MKRGAALSEVASSYKGGVPLVLQVVGTILVTLTSGVAATMVDANWDSKAQKGKGSVGII